MNNFNRNNLLLSILKKYFNCFFKLNSNIKLIEQNDYYIIYFMDESFFNKNKDIIESLFKYLDNKYKNILHFLDLFIGCDYIYNFYINEEDLIEQEKNGLCNDLTLKLFPDYNYTVKTIVELLLTLFDFDILKKDIDSICKYKKEENNLNTSSINSNIEIKNKKEYNNINNYEVKDEYFAAA